jgi:hypothetical protein
LMSIASAAAVPAVDTLGLAADTTLTTAAL